MYKLELTLEEIIFLRVHLDSNASKELIDKLSNPEHIYVSARKKRATQKATKVRSDRAKEKIQNAINLLHLENKAITHYSISKESGVSYNTVKKHIPDIDKIGKL